MCERVFSRKLTGWFFATSRQNNFFERLQDMSSRQHMFAGQ